MRLKAYLVMYALGWVFGIRTASHAKVSPSWTANTTDSYSDNIGTASHAGSGRPCRVSRGHIQSIQTKGLRHTSWPFVVSGVALMRLNFNKELSHEDRTSAPDANHHA